MSPEVPTGLDLLAMIRLRFSRLVTSHCWIKAKRFTIYLKDI
jgi:hypothetical protein